VKTLSNKADQQEILDRVMKVSHVDERKWGKMSVHEMLCHLTDAYRVALGEKAATSATNLIQRTVVKHIALHTPLRWMRGYPTRPEIDQAKGGTPPADFEADKATLIAIVRRFCEDLPQPCVPHPGFGEMDTQDWRRWGYLHADHHLRQFGR
jgi:hypothetical protein